MRLISSACGQRRR